MNFRIKVFISTLLFLNLINTGFSQEVNEAGKNTNSVLDSLKRGGVIYNGKQEKPLISLTTNQSIRYLQQRYQAQFWKNSHDPLRLAIGQLVFEASHPPYDSSKLLLRSYPFDSLDISWDKFYIWEPLKLKIPYVRHPESPLPLDSIMRTDSIQIEGPGDSIRLSQIKLVKPLPRSSPVTGLKDTTILVVVDTIREVSSDSKDFPYTYYNYPYQSDSTRIAVKQLLNFLEERDSSIVYVTGLGRTVIPVWINSKSESMYRYWLKNDLNDSVTVWLGSTDRNTIGLYLEQGVSFRRPVKQGILTEARIEVQEVDKSKLLEAQKITIKNEYWRYRSEASFALNQASLTNWVKGGESSVSTSLDITGYADYDNKALKVTSSNFARLKYGLIWSDENGMRKNLDLLETNSKLNHKAFGKFDFSAILLFKTQVAKGYNYPNDSVAVSKFMNPGILTAGFGLDYKPNKNTSINFSPFSYKGTFVTDTANIDQTKYGVAADRKSKNEPGASFMITHLYKPFKTVSITNRLQLFTNYINNPLNIDIDWEMILTANLNWFTDVRLNTHLIFDDDTKTPVLDKDKQPVMVGGKPVKTARIQFKELLGFSFIFRF
jgi:hypothetical protein